jgi:hypothetical protein
MLKSELSCLSLLNKISIASDADFLIVRLAEEEGLLTFRAKSLKIKHFYFCF